MTTRFVSVLALCLGAAAVANARQTPVTVTVTNVQQQSFDGFGVCVSNTIGEFLPAGGRRDAAGSVSRQVYDRLFQANNVASLRLSFLRLPVNADAYKNSSSAGYDFSSSVEKFGQGDVIRAARSRNSGLKLLYSSWTPPSYMKYNNQSGNGGAPATFDPDAPTDNRLKTTEYGNYASLLKQFTEDFRTKFGYYPHALGLQNEPDVSIYYGSCVFTADQFVSLLAETRARFPWGSVTKLWGPELGKPLLVDYFGKVATAGNLDAAATHSYNGNVGDIPDDWHRNNLKVNMTEFSPIPGSDYGNDPQRLAAATINRFCKDVNRGKAASWFFWNAVGVKTGSDAPDAAESLIQAEAVYNPQSVYTFVDQSGGQGLSTILRGLPAGPEYSTPYQKEFSTFTLSPQYYAFRRLTHSVTPGSVARRTDVAPGYTSGAQDDVFAAGFRQPNNGKFVLVVANKSANTTYQGTLKINELAAGGTQYFSTYYTSSDGSGPKNDVSWTTGFTNGQVSTPIYPRSVTIFVQN